VEEVLERDVVGHLEQAVAAFGPAEAGQRDVGLGGELVVDAAPRNRQERGQEDQPRDGTLSGDDRDRQAAGRVADQYRVLADVMHRGEHGLRVARGPSARLVAGQVGRKRPVPAGFEDALDGREGPASVPVPVDEDERGHRQTVPDRTPARAGDRTGTGRP
jgi:hypothetical protein